jgi:molybdopterin molybdotransferase
VNTRVAGRHARRDNGRVLSIDQARSVVLAAVRQLPTETVAVDAALDRVLGEDVVATRDVPPFAGSAMDGFALRSADSATAVGAGLVVVGESRAGAPAPLEVGAGEAIRISTGAVLPGGADAVIPVELTREAGGRVHLSEEVVAGRNVRGAGDDLRAGGTVLPRGSRLGPAELGVAVAAGRGELLCARRPRVAIVATGDELVAPGADLQPGQIHNSNAVTLAALARRAGAEVVTAGGAADTAQATRDALAEALEQADVVIASGGVSVGPHDHVKGALAALGVAEGFWRVALRPGKPTWFGTRGEQLVLGLPGNPVSAMVTFVLFARPALAALQGADPAVHRLSAVLASSRERHPARDECVRVLLDEQRRAHVTGPQGSHVLSSMLGADGLAVIPRGEGELPEATPVEVELL